MKKIATFHSSLTAKFGTPRQAGVVPDVRGRIVFEKTYRSPDAVRGMEGFDYLWLIWGFSANKVPSITPSKLTVRPPRLGGNERIGVFASRSPYRPNPIGLSSVRIERIDYDCDDAPVIHVLGADLIDGTPVYDIKPYIPYTDAHPDARSGFVNENHWSKLNVEVSEEAEQTLNKSEFSTLKAQFHICRELLAEDPRPHYHNSPSRIYNMEYDGFDVAFRVNGTTLTIIRIKKVI